MSGNNNQRTPAQRQDDRQRISELILKGWTQRAIAKELGLSPYTVSRDIKVIERHRLMTMVKNLDVVRQRELAKLDHVEKEAWEAWERSKKPFIKKAVKTRQKPASFSRQALEVTNIEKREEDRNGDPRYLEIIMRCHERRAQLMGLDAPQKIAPVTPDGQQSWTAIQVVEVVRPPQLPSGITVGNDE